MKLLPRQISQQFQKNIRQHVFANEVMVKIQRIRECFQGSTLPFSTPEVIAAWNDVPNVTTDVLPMSMKTELVFLPAPPPTPTGHTFDADEVALGDLVSYGDWVFDDHADSPTPDEVAFGIIGGPWVREDDQISRRSHPHQSQDQQSHAENSSQSTDSPSLSSRPESFSWRGSRRSNTPVGFHHMANQWMLDYRARGAEPFIESLVAFGIVSPGCAPLAARIARVVARKVASASYTEGKNLEHALRSSALATFKGYWEWNDTRTDMSSTASPTPRAVNIASFMGCLYDAGIFDARDAHLCLSTLSEGEKCYDRLCAMHALLIQANDKLCKTRNLPALMRLKDDITSRDEESGGFLWATTSHSRTILTEILTTIERWMVSQALKRDQYRRSGNRTVRKSAVGPRLRADGHVSAEPFIVQIVE